MNATQKELDELFTLPTNPPSALAPARLPGPTHESALALLKTLKDNHKRWHVFFNDKGFHNHASHHLLAIYALGANGTNIEAAYKTHEVYQRPAIASPGPIDESNWKDHLGNEKYYTSYVEFFTRHLLSKGGAAVLEEYIFSKNANTVPGKNGQPPEMLNRFHAGLVHPLIHTAYGAEFGLLGMFAEGLAQTAVHGAETPAIVPLSLFDSSAVTAATDALASLTVSLKPTFGQKPLGGSGVHALTILARVLHDPAFSPQSVGENMFATLKTCGEAIHKIASAWSVAPTHADVARKFEEVVWVNALIYGVGGWGARAESSHEKREMNADFFTMHLVTSSVLLPSLLAHISPANGSLLLRTYLATSLLWYVARGRPALPIADFFANTTADPAPPGPAPSVAPTTLSTGSASYTSNPWTALIANTVVHPNEHFCKLVRALAHFGAVLGGTPPGHFAALAEEQGKDRLEGLEKVDGSLFVRVAGLSMGRLGWMREGEAAVDWDRKGFFGQK